MSIYSALSSAIAGLNGQSFALSQISGNIANSQTTGFKRTETAFADMIQSSPYDRQIAGGANPFTRPTNDVQGDINNADVPTHMAINGSGYFMVSERDGGTGGEPAFADASLYTRRGDFELDSRGHLVNGTGYYLQGTRLDPQSGNAAGGQPEPVQITADFLPAQSTTEISLRANLAAFPQTSGADPDDPGSELLDPGDFANDPTAGGDGFVQGDDADTFLEQSISGGSITAYDSSGKAVNLQLRWAKVDSAETGGEDTWNLFHLTDANADGADPAWENAGQDYTFNSEGQLDPAFDTVNLDNVMVNGTEIGDIAINHGSSGITQFDDPNGVAKTTEITQNGFAAGELVGLAVSEDGRLVGSYTNGRSLDLFEIATASFNAPNRLDKRDGGAFAETQDSGPAILGASGTVTGSALEGSNTDIADEFSKLITTQQAYSANTRIVTTGNEMLQEVLNMVR